MTAPSHPSQWRRAATALAASTRAPETVAAACTPGELRSAGLKDVAEWLPPAEGYRCTYLADWTVVKTRWGLSVDQVEAEALHRLAADCANEPLILTLAR